jgi:CRP-like cAMP-binding protein
MIIGGGVFSFIVGNTANLLTRLDSQGKELEDLMERVSDFMQHNKVPLALRDQCARWIKFQSVNSVQIPKALTHNLSDTLRAELYVFVNRGFLERTAVLSRHLTRRHSVANGAHGEDEGAHAAASDGRNQDDRFLGLLMEACREQHLCPGETIFIQGCTGTDMYFIEQGQVDITRLREDGSSSCVLSTLYTGAVFGEGSFVSKDNERRTYTARSRTWLKLKVISTQELKVIASRFPRLKAPFMHDIELFSKKFEESLQISMQLEDKIGRLTARKGNVLPDSIVESILANAYMVHKWKDPESVRARSRAPSCCTNAARASFILSSKLVATSHHFSSSTIMQVFSDSIVQAAENSVPGNTDVQSLVDSVTDIFNDLSPRPLAQAAAGKDMHSLASLLDGFGDTISTLEESEKGRVEAFREIRWRLMRRCAAYRADVRAQGIDTESVCAIERCEF